MAVVAHRLLVRFLSAAAALQLCEGLLDGMASLPGGPSLHAVELLCHAAACCGKHVCMMSASGQHAMAIQPHAGTASSASSCGCPSTRSMWTAATSPGATAWPLPCASVPFPRPFFKDSRSSIPREGPVQQFACATSIRGALFLSLCYLQKAVDACDFGNAPALLRPAWLFSHRSNLMLYAVLGGLGAAGIAVLLVFGHLSPTSIVGIAIAASNAFGLIAGVVPIKSSAKLICQKWLKQALPILIMLDSIQHGPGIQICPDLHTSILFVAMLPLLPGIFLMGYGLVAIPRTLWRLADERGRTRLTCHKAGVQARRALDAHQCALPYIWFLTYDAVEAEAAGSRKQQHRHVVLLAVPRFRVGGQSMLQLLGAQHDVAAAPWKRAAHSRQLTLQLTVDSVGVHALQWYSQLTLEVATAHKVAGMFGRRDPMRRYMDKITALADDLGEHPMPVVSVVGRIEVHDVLMGSSV